MDGGARAKEIPHDGETGDRKERVRQYCSFYSNPLYCDTKEVTIEQPFESVSPVNYRLLLDFTS